MIRPCFIVVDRDYAGNISTRKLVIETAKLNVITAYSGAEAIESLKRFPNVDGIVADTGVQDVSLDELIRSFKTIRPKIPVISISSPGAAESDLVDYQLESFEPVRLLELLRSIARGPYEVG